MYVCGRACVCACTHASLSAAPVNMPQQTSFDSEPKRCRAIMPVSFQFRIYSGMFRCYGMPPSPPQADHLSCTSVPCYQRSINSKP